MARKKKTIKYPEHLLARVKILQKRIKKWKVDALLVTNAKDIRYLTGFVGDDSWALVQRRSKDVIVLSDSRFDEHIDREAPHVTKIIRTKGLIDVLGQMMAEKKLKRVGIQQSYLTVGQRKHLEKKLGKRKFKDVDDKLIEQRAIKIKSEIRLIQKAADIQQEAFRRTLKFIKPGMTEQKIAGFLEYQMRDLGAEDKGFHSIVAADANAALPHAIPGKTKVRKNGILLIDWGAMYGGYRSDMTRVIALGKWPAKIKEIYPIVLAAQLAAIDLIKPGAKFKDIDKAARDVIKDAGYEKYFQHGLGHGIGLDIHEQPNLGAKAKGELEPGQVITVEPGIYLRGIGGVRIEDDILVTERGKRVMTKLPTDFRSNTI
jgi:Xaa-Pro aminopeptidase